jgi:hypothetical protein
MESAVLLTGIKRAAIMDWTIYPLTVCAPWILLAVLVIMVEAAYQVLLRALEGFKCLALLVSLGHIQLSENSS